MRALAAHGLTTHHFVDDAPPRVLARAGSEQITNYPYRDDALLVWAAIEDWASAYVHHCYASDQAVSEDRELAAWVAQEGGVALRDDHARRLRNAVEHVGHDLALAQLLAADAQPAPQHDPVALGPQDVRLPGVVEVLHLARSQILARVLREIAEHALSGLAEVLTVPLEDLRQPHRVAVDLVARLVEHERTHLRLEHRLEVAATLQGSQPFSYGVTDLTALI